MHPGQGHRQLDQPQGRRGVVPALRAQGARLRRCGRRHGVRREGSGRHGRTQGLDLRALLQVAHGAGRLSARRHHLRPEHLRRRHRHRRAQQLREGLHRGDGRDQARLPACAHQRRRQQRVVLVPRQRPGARGDALGVPVSRHQGRHDDGHRQCRPAGDLRRHQSGAARARRGRDPQPASGRHRTTAGDRGALQGRDRRSARRRTSPGAAGRS